MKLQKIITSLSLALVSALFMTSCSSDSDSGPNAGSLYGIWSITNATDAHGNTANMQLEFMTMSYAQYAPTIGQSVPTNIPYGAMAYSKTTVTTSYVDPSGGYPWGSSSQTSASKKYTKEVGYFTVSNATGTDKLILYPQATLTSNDGMSWYNDGGSSVTMTEYNYTVSTTQLIFHLPDLTNQVWTKGAGGNTPVTNTLVGVWGISNMNQNGNSVNMELELNSMPYNQYAPTINQPVPTGLSDQALAYAKTVVTTEGGSYDPWSGSSTGTKSYAKEIGYYTTTTVGSANKLTLYSVVKMTSEDGVSWKIDNTSAQTITEYIYVLNSTQLIFNLPDLTQQVWTRKR